MKRVILVAFLLSIGLSVACGRPTGDLFTGEPDATATSVDAKPTPTQWQPDAPASPTVAEATSRPSATPQPTATPLPTSTATFTPTPPPADLSISTEDVYLYPAPSLYAGDIVTVQMFPHVPDEVASDNVTVHISIDGAEIADGVLGGRSHLSGEVIGLFEWVWDTRGLEGAHQLEVILDQEDAIVIGDENPDNNQVIFSVMVHERELLPAAEANAIWKMAESECCNVHVVSGTAADRDLPELLAAVDAAVAQASTKLHEDPERRFDVYYIDRVIGQGGYAGSAVVVSYLDRDYASNNLRQVLVHESVHLLDRQFAPQRIPFLAEGLAVWASEGHYKREDIEQAAAALLKTGRYIPLSELINDFYPVQHEIGYLQAGALVGHLIDTYGWPRFRTFYAEVTQEGQGELSGIFDTNLKRHYAISLDELERSWKLHLEGLFVDNATVQDIVTTVRFYDVMRAYQRRYDPTAHFLIAWLPSPTGVQEHGNPADLTRHPESELNVTLEVMLAAAGEAMLAGDYSRANTMLGSVERVLDMDGHFIDPSAVSYWNIVQTATEMGYEVQQVKLTGNEALVLAADIDTQIISELGFVLRGQEWIRTN